MFDLLTRIDHSPRLHPPYLATRLVMTVAEEIEVKALQRVPLFALHAIDVETELHVSVLEQK